ncbi:acyltransferase family protein [Massilia horti]|uniref:Acyltransferase n=1 Tax=Massilia horti TaxID=2562153 RepID=A0A4Y9SW21_9BURK|nr:acyltransferase [Massilia horti]TFW30675.1 acyltransferase [Massilia horti]
MGHSELAISRPEPSQRQRELAPQHLDYLDGWRGLAILFLLAGHFYPVAGINLGAVGVNLFFVLSGLLMAQLLFVAGTPIPTFYRRRISRILPGFVVMLGLVTAWWALSGRTVQWHQVAAAALFVNNYTAHAPGEMPFGHIWSLSVEEHSYVLLSLVALAARRTGRRPGPAVALLALVFAGCGLWYWSRFSGPGLDFGLWLHTEVQAFGVFLSAALLLVLRKRRVAPLPWLVLPVLVAAGIALHWWSVPAPLRTVGGVGLFALAVNLLRAAPPPLKAALSLRPLRQMGIWSFSIYLWQQPFYLATQHAMPAWIALALAIAAGIVSFYCIERPARAWLNAHWGGRAG